MALQIISFQKTSENELNDATTIHFNEDNLQMVLEQVDGRPICSIAICGPSRQGKSFILGHMLRCLSSIENDVIVDDWMDWKNQTKPLEEGFAWGSNNEDMTQGIWIWNKPFIMRKEDVEFAVILIDTQGLYDESTSYRDITAIAGLAFLMSSVTIFNTFTNIQEDILDSLATCVEYAKMAIELFDPENKNPFQKINFLIRDWNNPSQHNYGKAGGKHFIEKKLEIKPSQPASMKNNRRIITESFSNIECYLMPGIGERALVEDFDGSIVKMSPGFAEKLEQFIGNLFFKELPLKMVADNLITGNDFVDYLKTCVEMFNRGSIPMENALKVYSDTFKASFGENLYLNNRMLIEAHESSKTLALNFVKKLKTLEEKDDIKVQLLSKIDSVFAKNEIKNQKIRTRALAKADTNADSSFQQLFSSVILDQAEDLVDNDFIDILANKATTQVIEAFSNQICGEEESDKLVIVARLQEKLTAIVQSVKSQNDAKLNHMETAAEHIVKYLAEAYKAKIMTYLELNKDDPSELEEVHEAESKAAHNELVSRNPFPSKSSHYKGFCDKLSNDIGNIYRLANKKVNAKMYITRAVSSYNKVLISFLENLKENDMEALLSYHELKKLELKTKFDGKYAALDDHNRQSLFEELVSEIDNAFKVHQRNLSLNIREQDLNFQKRLADARKYYQNEMQHQMQTHNAFGNDELHNMHLGTIEKIIQNCNVKLTASSLEKLNHELDTIFQQYQDKNTMKFNMMSDIAIGIDLGTTNCCMAVCINGKVHIVPNSLGKDVTPSYVQLREDDTEIVGDVAKDTSFENPENTIFNAKRMIGRRMDDVNLKDDLMYWPFIVQDVAGYPKIIAHNKQYYPEQISAKLLKKLRSDAEKFLRHPLKKAVITVPAYFTNGQRQATLDAAEMVGFTVLDILNEPTAAAIAYKINRIDDQPKKVLIFDLGGGTFDVAVLNINGSEIDVLAVDGDTHFGGEDFDKEIMKFCVQEFQRVHGINLLEGKDSAQKTERDKVWRRLMRLQACCETRKKYLSVDDTAKIGVDEIVPGIDLSINISRCQFEELIDTYFIKLENIVNNALKSANVSKHDIEDIVMVGGSTRIVKVQEFLKDFFKGKAMNTSINPDEAVAYGAAVRAAILNGKELSEKMNTFKTIQDVTPMSYGTEEEDGGFSIIIPKGSKIPATFTETYETTEDDQIEMGFGLYQGQDPVADKNILLDNFTFVGIPPRPAGKERVVLEMNIITWAYLP